MSNRVSYRSFVLFSLTLLVTAGAFADGIYVPAQAVESLPDMPRQRAVIVWRDGVEELLVESDFDGEGEEMAWIVPVPGEPSELAIGAPGVFDTFGAALLPETLSGAGFLIFLGLLLTVWSLTLFAYKEFAPLKSCGCAALIVIVIGFILLPALSRSRGAGSLDTANTASNEMAGVDVLSVSTIGSYEVTTLRTQEAEALTRWLESNGFRNLPDGGAAIVAEYIEEGWCFVTAKLKHTGDGYGRPHPLAITFNTEAPVYPMRLTRLAGTDLLLDLYVIADQRATAPAMETIYCNRYHYRDGMPELEIAGVPIVQGTAYSDSMIALPWLTSRMRDQDVITHLRAEVASDAMHQDIPISFTNYTPFRQRLHLPGEQEKAIIGYGLCTFGFLMVVGLLLYHEQKKAERKLYNKPMLFLVALLVALVVSQIPRFTYTPGERLSGTGKGSSYYMTSNLLETFHENADAITGMDRDALEAYLLECIKTNKYKDAPAETYLGEGPGRFEVIEDERGILLRSYEPHREIRKWIVGLPLEYLILRPDGTASEFLEYSMFSTERMCFALRQVHFNSVPVGQVKAREVLICNAGQFLAEGSLVTKPPFYIRDEDARYSLKPGACKTITIDYRPTEEGSHKGEVDFLDVRSWFELEVFGHTYAGEAVTEGIRLNEHALWRRERMLRNIETAYPNRIELINEHDYPVDLAGWGLTNDPETPSKYIFPEGVVIRPWHYITVYAVTESKPSAYDIVLGFELQASTGGFIGLTNPQGEVISEIRYPAYDAITEAMRRNGEAELKVSDIGQ